MRLLKQIAAEQRKTAEHATAPAVYGVDGRLVHGLGCQMQTTRAQRPLDGRHIQTQLLQKIIVRQRAAGHSLVKPDGGVMQALAYALAQLCGGRFSESHDQNLARA